MTITKERPTVRKQALVRRIFSEGAPVVPRQPKVRDEFEDVGSPGGPVVPHTEIGDIGAPGGPVVPLGQIKLPEIR